MLIELSFRLLAFFHLLVKKRLQYSNNFLSEVHKTMHKDPVTEHLRAFFHRTFSRAFFSKTFSQLKGEYLIWSYKNTRERFKSRSSFNTA